MMILEQEGLQFQEDKDYHEFLKWCATTFLHRNMDAWQSGCLAPVPLKGSCNVNKMKSQQSASDRIRAAIQAKKDLGCFCIVM